MVEASEAGYHSKRRELGVAVDDLATRISMDLEKDLEHPRWVEADPSGRLFVEVFGGPAIAPTLGGDAEATCDLQACSDNPLALGFFGGIRAGYELPFKLSFEVAGGYLSLSKSVARVVREGFSAVDGSEVQVDYRLNDELSLRGGFIAGGLGYRVVVAAPFEVRAHVLLGILFASAKMPSPATPARRGRWSSMGPLTRVPV